MTHRVVQMHIYEKVMLSLFSRRTAAVRSGVIIFQWAVMWSETGAVLGQDRSETPKNRSWSCTLDLGLAGLVLLRETRSCYARRHNDLEGRSNLSSTTLLCAWNITVKINSGVHLLKS